MAVVDSVAVGGLYSSKKGPSRGGMLAPYGPPSTGSTVITISAASLGGPMTSVDVNVELDTTTTPPTTATPPAVEFKDSSVVGVLASGWLKVTVTCTVSAVRTAPLATRDVVTVGIGGR